MKKQSVILACLPAAFALGLPGCAWFLLGGVGGITYSLTKDDGDEGPVNAAPALSISSPASNELVSDRVVVKYTLMDPESNACTILVGYSTDDGQTWSQATEVRSYPSEGVAGLTASPSGESHAFVWNSMVDVGEVNYPDATAGRGLLRLRLKATDAQGLAGAPVLSHPFRLYNAYVSTFFGGELTELKMAFPAKLLWLAGSGGGSDKLYITDEFQSTVSELDLDSGAYTTIAGTGAAGYTGDNIPADTAGLTIPGQAAADGQGNFYIADTRAHRVRQVDATSRFITTVVGTGERGFEGDGGEATTAKINTPTGVAFDPTRSLLYVAEQKNRCVRVTNMGSSPKNVGGVWIAPGAVATILGNPNEDWEREQDGPAGLPGSVGKYASLRLDSNNYACIAYHDETNGFLKYAWFNGTRWSTTAVDILEDVGAHCSLALDGSDNPHISYYDAKNGDLKYAVFMGAAGGWNIITVDGSDEDVGQNTSIALDAGGNPFISYYAVDRGQLRVAEKVGNFWRIHDQGWQGGEFTSLALDSGGNPHVAFYDAIGGDLKYIYYDGSNWQNFGGPLVVSTGNVGMYASLALDGSDYPHIAYFDAEANNGDVMYIRWTGAAWAAPVSVDGAGGNAGEYCSIALDGNGYPHVSYYNRDLNGGELNYAADLNGNNVFEAGEKWTVDGTSGNERVGLWTSLALEGNLPRIAYVYLENAWPVNLCRLRLAWSPVPSAFKLRQVDSGTTAGIGRPVTLQLDGAGNLFISTQDRVKFFNRTASPVTLGEVTIPSGYVGTIAGVPTPFTNMAVDGLGNYHVVYTDPTRGVLRYALKLPTIPLWTREDVPDTSANFGAFPSLVVDGSGNVHVAYHDADAKTIKYALKTGANWTIESPAGAATDLGPPSSLALDGSGFPCVAYYDAGNGDLMHVARGAGGWGAPVIVDGAAGDVGAFPSLAFEGAVNRGIAYLDVDNNALKYAYFNGAAWSTTTVDNSEPAGKWASLAFDGANNPHISYYATWRKALKYAVNTGAWSILNVDVFGNVGKHSSIIVNGAGNPVIAYLNASKGRGAIARWNGTFWERNEFGWSGAAHPHLVLDSAGNHYISHSRPFDGGDIEVQYISQNFNNWNTFRVESHDFQDQYGGDGGPALAARFSELMGIALGRYGTYGGAPPEYDALLLADAQNSRIRVINLNDPNGANPVSFTVANVTVAPAQVDTLVGDGTFGYDPNDDGAEVNNAVNPVKLAMPQDVATDAGGNIFIADAINLRIRVINVGAAQDFAGITVPPGAIQTVAGEDITAVPVTASLFYPSGVAVDPVDGSVYVTDYIGYIFRVDSSARVSTPVAGTGTFGFSGDGAAATAASFWGAHDVVVDREQNLYILDRGNFRVRAVNLRNTSPTYQICGKNVVQGNIDTILGTGVFTFSIDGPLGTDLTDELGDGGHCTSATVTDLNNLAIDTRPTVNTTANARGLLYVSDSSNNRVRVINLNPLGSPTITLCGGAILVPPEDIVTVLGTGFRLWDIDGPGGNPLDDFTPGAAPNAVAISRPGPIAIDKEGILYVLCRDGNVLFAVNTSNTASDTVAGVTIAPGTVQRIAGGFFRDRGYNGDGIPALDAQFEEPAFMAVWREGAAVALERQEIYISDRTQQRIRLIDENGVIFTWAGTGDAGFNGDGVPPSNVLVNDPAGMAIYESGSKIHFYYVDQRNKRVRWQVK